MKPIARWTSVILLTAGLLPNPVFAMGDDDGSSATKTPVCKKGYVYSSTKKRCVKQSSEHIPDRSLIKQGWALAYAGKYEQAANLFHLVKDKLEPSSLNGLGYSYRKMGRIADGITYYKAALAADPDYHLAREYLGEGYVSSGQIDLAKEQLSEIERRCGKSCREYKKLARAIVTGSVNDW